jgi:uncharacterized protein (DUF885 family)
MLRLFVLRLPVLFLVWCSVLTVDLVPQTTSQTQSSPASRLIEEIDTEDLSAPEGVVAGLIRRYTADRGSLHRFHTAPYSSVREARFRQFSSEWLSGLQALDFDRMNQQERVDYVLFRNHLERQIRQLEIDAMRFKEMEPLIPFARTLIALEDDRRALKQVDQQRVAATLHEVLQQVQSTRKLVEAGLKGEGKGLPKGHPAALKKTVANRAFEALGSLRTMLKNWYTFHQGYDPLFSWWVESPYNLLDAALKDYATFVREKVVGVKADDTTTIVGDPIGRETLLSELAFEMIPYTPEELITLANREMAWCEEEMRKASRELGFGDDWHKALEHVKNLYVAPGEQPALISDLAWEAIDFVERNNLMTVPRLAKETWRMEMMTPERQLIAPFFLGGEVIQVSYPTNTMTHEQKLMSMRGNNPHFSRAVAHHELIPGHHMQGFMNARYRTYRSIFGTPFWGEGWALYWELLLWDKDFPRSPEDRVGMLFWRMHRCARIIFSLSFHLEKMTPQECIDMLVNRVGHEPDNATAEVRRSFSGQYGPLYQCAYLLGGLQFRSLHRELVQSGRMTDRQFHDTVMRNNSIPVEMVRAIMTDQPLSREHRPQWKFYGPIPAGR